MKFLIQANAKINLDFKIIKKLPNGYHQIESVFQSIDLADFLFFEKSKENTFTGAVTCPNSQDIVLKAKHTLEKFLKRKLPANIHIQKTIPIAAGLGGASTDAAATLIGLNELYKLNLSLNKLTEIGLKSGADVPFFFYGGTCKVRGIGEKITKIKRSMSEFFVLFRPHKRLETKRMYELHDQTGKTFFELSKEICSDIKKIERKIRRFPVKEFGLSGSGPTIFCGVNNYSAAKKLSENHLDFNGDIFVCRPQNKGLNIFKHECSNYFSCRK